MTCKVPDQTDMRNRMVGKSGPAKLSMFVDLPGTPRPICQIACPHVQNHGTLLSNSELELHFAGITRLYLAADSVLAEAVSG
jgi:hypothetical protein